jgi:hypothetical protein
MPLRISLGVLATLIDVHCRFLPDCSCACACSRQIVLLPTLSHRSVTRAYTLGLVESGRYARTTLRALRPFSVRGYRPASTCGLPPAQGGRPRGFARRVRKQPPELGLGAQARAAPARWAGNGVSFRNHRPGSVVGTFHRRSGRGYAPRLEREWPILRTRVPLEALSCWAARDV